MAAYTATVSTFSWNSVVIDAVGTVSASVQRPALDVTQVGSANTHHIPGVATSVVTADIYYNTGNHSALVSDFLNGTSRSFVFTVGPSGDTVSGTGLLTGLDIVSSNQDVVRGSISIQVEGPITIAGVTAPNGANEV
jgi:hypothetical protein